MTLLGYLAIVLLIAGVAYLIVRRPVREYFAMRGDRIVTCPETHKHVGVAVDAAHAAISVARGFSDLRIERCSRWPERAGCGQECLREIEAAPFDCLVRNQLARWYAGKSCAVCGKPIGEIDWTHHRPALLAPDGRSNEWHEVKPEQLPSAMATSSPICWDCHIVEIFRRERAGLVIDNPFADTSRH